VKATEVTAAWQKVTAAYCQVYGVIHFMSPAGWLPVHRDQLRDQRSVTSMGKLYLFYHQYATFSPLIYFWPGSLAEWATVINEIYLPWRFATVYKQSEDRAADTDVVHTGILCNYRDNYRCSDHSRRCTPLHSDTGLTHSRPLLYTVDRTRMITQ